MFRTAIFIVASVLLLIVDRELQRLGVTSVPRWMMAAVWGVLALWARIDDGGPDSRTERAVRMFVLPVAGVFALYVGVVGFAIHGSLFGLGALLMLPAGAALLIWWVVELVRGRHY